MDSSRSWSEGCGVFPFSRINIKPKRQNRARHTKPTNKTVNTKLDENGVGDEGNDECVKCELTTNTNILPTPFMAKVCACVCVS